MKFNINNCEWKIKEDCQANIRSELELRSKSKIENDPTIGRYFGITYSDKNMIVIDEELPEDRKRNTLIHELTHCYISSFITHQEKSYDEEMVCDICANSNEIINQIVNNYFESKEKVEFKRKTQKLKDDIKKENKGVK